MAVSGPNGYTDISSSIQPVGTTEFEGSDSYTATTDLVSDGMAGDVYKCNATSVESVIGSITVEGNIVDQWFICLQPVPLYSCCCSNS